MNIWRSLSGSLDVELTSSEPETVIALINSQGIELNHIQKKDALTYTFQICRFDYNRLSAICESRGESLRIETYSGLYWNIRTFLNRPFFLTSMVLLLTMILILPTRVMFVRVDGNVSIPQRRILAAAEECGIAFGASRRNVRSEKVKNALLSAVPELQWAGINTNGCTAVISVRERSVQEDPQTHTSVSSITASRDGYVTSCTVTRGNLLVKEGQSVHAGQVLISGYTDCGFCIRAEQAEGEIAALTNRHLTAVTPREFRVKTREIGIKRKISLLLRKKRIFLWKDSGISGSSCGRMYEEYYISLPGGFQLPYALCIETYRCYQAETAVVSPADAKAGLAEFGSKYLSQQMIAGRILSTDMQLSQNNGGYYLNAEYACEEMIGQMRQEQIGDTNGEKN